jgi:hypothetical protein
MNEAAATGIGAWSVLIWHSSTTTRGGYQRSSIRPLPFGSSTWTAAARRPSSNDPGAVDRGDVPSDDAKNPTFGTMFRVAVSKVSLSIEEDVLTEARARAGHRELSSYVTDALRRQLQHDRLGELLAEMEAESGPIPEDLMEEARQLWRGPAAGPKPKPRRRSA